MPQVNYQKILLAFFGILIIAIPVGSYVVRQQTNFASKANQSNNESQASLSASLSAREVPKKLPSLDELKKQLENSVSEPSPTASVSAESTSVPQVSFGPTLNFKIKIEGRPDDNQSAAGLFIGLTEGVLKVNPTYLLTFTVDIPTTGIYSGLSLAGLTVNNTYTAYIKGHGQIATSSSFIIQPAATDLNLGQPLVLTSGDLNEDNSINTADYNLAKQSLGSSPSSSTWNSNIDFNLDSIINVLDLSIIKKNIGKVGAGSIYISTVATQPIKLISPSIGGLQGGSSPSAGYWMWIPNLSR